MTAKLSALRAGRLYHPGRLLVVPKIDLFVFCLSAPSLPALLSRYRDELQPVQELFSLLHSVQGRSSDPSSLLANERIPGALSLGLSGRGEKLTKPPPSNEEIMNGGCIAPIYLMLCSLISQAQEQLCVLLSPRVPHSAATWPLSV
jgi:hypothetical protein